METINLQMFVMDYTNQMSVINTLINYLQGPHRPRSVAIWMVHVKRKF